MTTVTKAMLATLKAAETISLHFERTPDGDYKNYTNSGTTVIRCSKQVAAKGFDATEVNADFPVESSVYCYGESGVDNPFDNAFESFYGLQHVSTGFIPVVTAAVRTLRVGDDISIQWVAGGGSTMLLEELGLVHDQVELHVRRGGKIVNRIILSSRVGRDNSARMIRKGLWNCYAGMASR